MAKTDLQTARAALEAADAETCAAFLSEAEALVKRLTEALAEAETRKGAERLNSGLMNARALVFALKGPEPDA